MGILSRMYASELDDPRLWTPPGTLGGWASGSGVRIDGNSARAQTTVLACVSVIAQGLADLGLELFERRADETRRQAREVPLYRLLHDAPNESQTSFEFVEMMTAHACLRGSAYARILWSRGWPSALIPLHPDRMVPKVQNGVLVYEYHRPDGQTELISKDNIFRVVYKTYDGINGVTPIAEAAEPIALALTMEGHVARLFSRGVRPSGVLQMDGKLSQPAYDRLSKSWDVEHGGLSGAGRTLILEEGMKWQQIGFTSVDAQLLENRRFQVEEIARLFRVPLQMIQHLDKQPTSPGQEQSRTSFAMFTLSPWAKRWQQAISRDLIVAEDTYYAEFNFNSLVKADYAARMQGYAVQIQNGILSPNEVRQLENMDPRPGGDTYMQPANMVPIGGDGKPVMPAAPPQQSQPPVEEPSPEDEGAAARAEQLARTAVARLLRKEQAALAKWSIRFASDSAKWSEWVEGFYRNYASFVSDSLALSEDEAAAYCTKRRLSVLDCGLAQLDMGAAEEELMALALGREETSHA
jgi:HK97 family phage portal protein